MMLLNSIMRFIFYFHNEAFDFHRDDCNLKHDAFDIHRHAVDLYLDALSFQHDAEVSKK